MGGYIGSGFEHIVATCDRAPFGHNGPKRPTRHGQLTYSTPGAAEKSAEPETSTVLAAVPEHAGALAVNAATIGASPSQIAERSSEAA